VPFVECGEILQLSTISWEIMKNCFFSTGYFSDELCGKYMKYFGNYLPIMFNLKVIFLQQNVYKYNRYFRSAQNFCNSPH